jgi:hypothetical protein
MMNMMYSTGTGFGSGFMLLWGLHVLSVIAFFIGVTFLIVWAVKTLTKTQLKTWGITLVVIGTLACLLTIGMRGAPITRMLQWNTGNNMPAGMMDSDGGGMGMMSNMGMMLEGLEGDEFDEAFIRLMIPHHEGAIDMAERALESAGHPEMKQLANDIIEAQQREIDMMRGWLQQWGYNE